MKTRPAMSYGAGSVRLPRDEQPRTGPLYWLRCRRWVWPGGEQIALRHRRTAWWPKPVQPRTSCSWRTPWADYVEAVPSTLIVVVVVLGLSGSSGFWLTMLPLLIFATYH
jgi:hypothetical protein